MTVVSMRNVNKNFKRYVKQEKFFNNFFSRQYDLKSAVANFDLDIEHGEILGLLGQNGAGKTTIMKLLTGLILPSSGEINVLGYKPFDKKNEFKKKISLLLGQKQQLWWDIPAVDNFKLFRHIYEIDESTYNKRLNEMVELLHIDDVINSPIRTLSLGERTKCELVAALLHNPQILFLDEPTIGLDLVAQKKVRDFIKEYSIRNNATVIITSHYMEDIEQLCSRTVFIDKGKKHFDGSLQTFVENFGDECILNIELNDITQKVDVSEFGTIVKQENNLIKLRIQKEESNNIRQKIMDLNNIRTVILDQLDASEIVRKYFAEGE